MKTRAVRSGSARRQASSAARNCFWPRAPSGCSQASGASSQWPRRSNRPSNSSASPSGLEIRGRPLAALAADRVHDLVLEDAGEPGAQVRAPGEVRLAGERREQGLLHGVLGGGRVAQLQRGVAQQVGPQGSRSGCGNRRGVAGGLKSGTRAPILVVPTLKGGFMANITRFDPFNDMVDDLFKGFLVRPVAYDGARSPRLPRAEGGCHREERRLPGDRRPARGEEGRHPGGDRRRAGDADGGSEAREGGRRGRARAAHRARRTARCRAASRCRRSWTRRKPRRSSATACWS